jgi:hypothetical protein
MGDGMSRFAIFLIMLMCWFIAPTYGECAPIARILDMRGNVSCKEKSGGAYRMAAKNMGLEEGYWIKTGADGWAVLLLSDDSRLTLANNTELETAKMVVGKVEKEGVFNLLQGKLRVSVKRLAGGQINYKFKSPTAVAGVRGTEFLMMTRKEANVFFGNSGLVDVSGEGTAAKLMGVGMMVQNTRNLAPIDPVKVEPGTLLGEAKGNFDAITAAEPPRDWRISDNLPDIIARWNINYGHYLVDSGRYEEALYVFQIAFDLSDLPDIKGDAVLERGTVYSRFTGNYEAALKEYLSIIETHPDIPQCETALYLAGITLYELGRTKQAVEKLTEYKARHPSGKHISNTETILTILGK